MVVTFLFDIEDANDTETRDPFPSTQTPVSHSPRSLLAPMRRLDDFVCAPRVLTPYRPRHDRSCSLQISSRRWTSCFWDCLGITDLCSQAPNRRESFRRLTRC